ncbi:MAG: TIGR02678 family protein [Longicatena sp.]
MNTIEELMNRRWILKRDEPTLYYEIKDNMKDIKKKIQDKFGYNLIVNPFMAKLEKIPGKAEGWMGLQEFEDIKDYQMFCYLLMFLEDKEVEEQFVLSTLTEYIQIQFDENEIQWTSFRTRKQLVRVIQYALKVGMIMQTDGDEDVFLKDETTEVLYENTGISRYYIRNFPIDIMNFKEPQDFSKSEWFDMDEDRGIVRKQRSYRRLLLSCGVYQPYSEDKEEDFTYIRNYRKTIESDFQELFPCELQVHSSCAFLVLGEECRMGKVFPQNSALHDLLLSMHEELCMHVHKHKVTIDEKENIGMRKDEYLSLLNRLVKNRNNVLPKKYQKENRDSLDVANDVMELARTLGFIEQVEEQIIIFPIAGKIIGSFMEERR